MREFTFTYSRKNDGSPSPYSAEQTAIDEAFVNFHTQGGWDWESFTVTKLSCDSREDHYPDLCWHYEIKIESQVEEKGK